MKKQNENNNRASGRTTRLADEYIQKLFTEGEINVKDHFPSKHSDRDLFNIIVKRIAIEHPNTKLILNETSLTIKIKHYESNNI